MKSEYFYEEPVNINGKTYVPDFYSTRQGKTAYLEHLGMLRDKSYKKALGREEANYESVGIQKLLEI